MSKWKGGKKLAVAAGIFIVLGSLSGCGNTVNNIAQDSFYERADQNVGEAGENFSDNIDRVYGDALDRLTDTEQEVEQWEGDDIFDKLTRKILAGWQRGYHTFRTLSPIICIVSITMGILIFTIARKNKRIKRAGLFVFIIGIPVAVLIAVFGIGVFNGIFLY